MGAALFALGIFEAGIVAAIAISTSSAYAFGEVFQTGHSLNRPLRDAWPFYLTLLGSAAFSRGTRADSSFSARVHGAHR